MLLVDEEEDQFQKMGTVLLGASGSKSSLVVIPSLMGYLPFLPWGSSDSVCPLS